MDGQVRVLESKMVKVRKIHKCHCCSKEIQKGNEAYYQKYVDDDENYIGDYRLCDNCYTYGVGNDKGFNGESCLECIQFCLEGVCWRECEPDYSY